MTSRRLRAFVLLCFVGHLSVSAAVSDDLTRYVTLRDGSILKVNLESPSPLKWSPEKDPVSLTNVKELKLSKEAAGKNVRTIRSLVKKLSSPSFKEREIATRQLVVSGNGFRSLMEELKLSITDPEANHRLNQIISKLSDKPKASTGYDLIVTREGDRFTGDVEEWSETVIYRGSTLTLTRKNVSVISDQLPKFASSAHSPLAVDLDDFGAIREDDDDNFTGRIVRIDFESDGEGKPLRIGEDISGRFKQTGFRVGTSIPGAIVSVNDFTVNGRSGGLSAATHAPLWEGSLIFKFHAPDAPSVPAFVKTAGLWVASVSPGGTALEAYDAEGELVGKVLTEGSGHEFLAFSSDTPITEVRVVPNPEIDRNYTIDDLFFTKPIPLNVIPEEGWTTIYTRSGERLLGRNLVRKDDALVIEGLSYGADTVQLKLADISSFAPKDWNIPHKRPDSSQHWALLNDGTKLLIAPDDKGKRKPVSIESSELNYNFEQIIAIWGLPMRFTAIPKEHFEYLAEGDRAVVNSSAKNWTKIKEVTWGESWIESPDRLSIRPTYKDSPMTWFSPPPEIDPNAGQIALKTGEVIVLPPTSDKKAGTRLLGFDSSTLYLRIEGKQATIPTKFVSFCQLPRLKD